MRDSVSTALKQILKLTVMKGQSQFNESWAKHQVSATPQPTKSTCINPRAAATGIVNKVVFIDQQGRRVESINGVKTVIGNTKRNRRLR